MVEYVFWLSVCFIAYTYFGYPLTLYVLSYFKSLTVKKGHIYPKISIVIAVRNEEKNIRERLEDLLAQEYPTNRREIIVVSDGSTDGTEDIVREYQGQNVRLSSLQSSKGKAEALNYGIAHAAGEVVVFADARQRFMPDALKHLVGNFNDPSVGCVSGELVFTESQGSEIKAEMGAYWHYEKWIRKCESRTGSVMGATGAIYAARTALYKPLPSGIILDDVLTPMNILKQGYRVVFDGSALACDSVSKDVVQEWRRKVRTLAGNWQLLSLSPDLLNPLRNPFWWRFVSHKIFRLIVPAGLVTMFVSSLLLSRTPGYFVVSYIQTALYVVGLAAVLAPLMRRFRLVRTLYFFLFMNAAAVVGFWQWISGRCDALWKPSEDSLSR